MSQARPADKGGGDGGGGNKVDAGNDKGEALLDSNTDDAVNPLSGVALDTPSPPSPPPPPPPPPGDGTAVTPRYYAAMPSGYSTSNAAAAAPPPSPPPPAYSNNPIAAAPPAYNSTAAMGTAHTNTDEAAAERYFSLSPTASTAPVTAPVTARSYLPPNSGLFAAGGFGSQINAPTWSPRVGREPPKLTMNGTLEPPLYGEQEAIPITPPPAHVDSKRFSKHASDFSNVTFNGSEETLIGGVTGSNGKTQNDAEKQAVAELATAKAEAEDWKTFIHRKRKHFALGMTALILVALAVSLTIRFTVIVKPEQEQ